MIDIATAGVEDLYYLRKNDKHIQIEVLERKIAQGEIIKGTVEGKIIGWIRHGLFWDSIPFMNLLYIEEAYRGKGYGIKLMNYWEETMKENGYQKVMTSTLSNEEAQCFYRKNGYKDIGGFLLEGEALEILFIKNLT